MLTSLGAIGRCELHDCLMKEPCPPVVWQHRGSMGGARQSRRPPDVRPPQERSCCNLTCRI
jgi:hypothetical protein